MTGPPPAGSVPAGPMLSMFDPIYVGNDEFGQPVLIRLIYKNLLAAGEPGGGKSGLLNTLAAHSALSADSRNVLFDAKQVELGMWDHIADEFVGPDIAPRHHHHAAAAESDGQPVRLAPRPPPPQDRTRRRHQRHHHHLRRDRRLRHRPRNRAGTTPVRLPAPRPGRPRPRRRHARHRRHPTTRRSTSSPRACATCSATAPPSAAPPTAPPTSSSATAGPQPESPPPPSAPTTPAKRS